VAVAIANSNPTPEYLESAFKSIQIPAINFVGTLLSGGPITVDVVGPNNAVYGTFTLDVVNQQVSSGLLTNLPVQLRYNVVSGTGKFTIVCLPGV
jgi:hypothetical protein